MKNLMFWVISLFFLFSLVPALDYTIQNYTLLSGGNIDQDYWWNDSFSKPDGAINGITLQVISGTPQTSYLITKQFPKNNPTILGVIYTSNLNARDGDGGSNANTASANHTLFGETIQTVFKANVAGVGATSDSSVFNLIRNINGSWNVYNDGSFVKSISSTGTNLTWDGQVGGAFLFANASISNFYYTGKNIINFTAETKYFNGAKFNLNISATLYPFFQSNLTNYSLAVFDENSNLVYLETNSVNTNNSINSFFNLSFSSLELNDIFNYTIELCGTKGCYIADNNESFTYSPLIELESSYPSFASEGTTANFYQNVSLVSGVSISSIVFNYDGNSTTAVTTSQGNVNILKKENFVIPNVDSSTNKTFFFEVLLSNGNQINITSNNISVYNLGIDSCSVFTNSILQFNVVDEEFQTALTNVTLEINVNIYDSSKTNVILNFSDSSTSPNYLICLQNNITETSDYLLDATIKYTGLDYAVEYYNIQSEELDEDYIFQNITLFSLNSSDSTEFQLSVTGFDYLPLLDALVFVERQYLAENTFKVVELPLTDSNGQAVLHLVRNDILYNVRIVKDGVLIGNFQNIIAFCEDFTIGNCKINLNANEDQTLVFDYNEELGIIFEKPTYNNNTRVINFDFVSNDGTNKEVRLFISRNDIFGNSTICDTTLISSGGSIFCVVPSSVKDTQLLVQLDSDGERVYNSYIKLEDSNLGEIGYLGFFMFAMTLITIFSKTKNGVLLAILISFVGAIGLNMITGSIIGLGSSGIWLIIMLIIAFWKLNKERIS